MAQLDVRGRIQYAPGPWGLALPAAGVNISLTDKDVGSADDTIWTGVTNSNGEFSGRTSDWRDTKTITVSGPTGTYQQNVADASDVMSLQAKVKQRVDSLSYEMLAPFIPAPPGMPQPPIVLNWGPPGRAKVTVNGFRAISPNQFAALLQSTFGSGNASPGARHEICVTGEEAGAVWRFLQSVEPEMRAIGNQIDQLLTKGLSAVPVQSSQQSTMLRDTLVAGAQQKAVLKSKMVSALPSGGAADGWEAVRQRLLDFTRGLEAKAREVPGCAQASGVLSIIVAIVLIVIAVVVATFTFGLSGPLLMVSAVAAVGSAATMLIQRMPSLLAAVGLNSAAADMQQFLNQSTWLGSMMTVVFVICALVILAAASPAAGWKWVVSQMNNAGVRFVFAG